MILVDTSVLLDLATEDPKWFAWSSAQVAHFANVDELVISAIIYAELAVKAPAKSDLDRRARGSRTPGFAHAQSPRLRPVQSAPANRAWPKRCPAARCRA